MKADWIIRIEMSRFFDRAWELRARTSKGTLKDLIYRAMFAAKLEEEFTSIEIRRAIDAGFLASDQVRTAGSLRNIYIWLEKECQFQPVWYKRQLYNLKSWVATHVFSG